jgi:glycosyltransferase involved in cell wall biosynthesis
VVARLREEKNLGLLLDAVAALGGRVPQPYVVIVGDGPEHEALVARARALGIGERVVFAGHMPNRPNPHQLFDVSVLCSAHEGFPNTLVEAMAAARPVVATRVGGVPDAVVDGLTGALVGAGDAAGLADALAAVLGAPARAAEMGAAGEARARAEFHIDTVLPRLVGLYDTLLARAGRRTHLSAWRA